MPPLLVALFAAGIIALIPRKNSAPGAPTIVQTTPANNPPGILTSFAPPPIQNYAQIPSSAPIQTNQPGTSGSGVPAWSSNAQEFNNSPYMAAPAPSTRIPGFYAGPIGANLKPAYKSVKVPKSTRSSGCSGSCGSSCSGGCQNPSDCSVASQRNQDGGCLAPTMNALVRSAPPGVLESWIANMVSAGVDPYQAAQQNKYDQQNTAPNEEDITVPASPFIQGIGINNMRPIRSAIAG